MFRCVRGHKLQAILPDVLKVTLTKVSDYYCCYFYYYYTKKSIRRIMKRENEMDFFILFFWSNFKAYNQVRLIIDPCFRLMYMIYQAFKQHRNYYRRKFFFFRELLYIYHHPLSFRYIWEIKIFLFCNIVIYCKYTFIQCESCFISLICANRILLDREN